MENFEKSNFLTSKESPSESETDSFVNKNKGEFSPEISERTKEVFESRQYEKDLVVENPEYVGINFDQDLIIDARNFWSQDQWIQYLKERDGTISDEFQNLIKSGEVEKIIEERRRKENEKLNFFKDYLSSFEGKLQHVRINPAGECSPISPSQAIETKPDGTWEVKISPEFINQIKLIQEQCPDVTLVVPFYDHRRGKEKASDVPETKEQIEQYIGLSERIIEVLGEDIQLEIGNETNVSRKTAAVFADKLQHASHVNSIEYAKFFFEVSKRIKEKHPKVKLEIAGVALYDPTYLKEVLNEISRLKQENRIQTFLVDTISFHPYRETPEEGSIEVEHGEFKITSLDYNNQLEEMRKIASEFGVQLNIGEINFPLKDPAQKTKLKKAISSTADKGILSLIYPAINTV